MARRGGTLADAVSFITRLPQTLINVPNVDKTRTSEVMDVVAVAEKELGDTGRVLLRASGTEPLVRVMVEAPTQEQADSVAQRLADVVAQRLAL